MPDCVAYYRVSTDKQGLSGLGLEAQRAAVGRYLHGHGGTLLAEFTEVESGRKADRPELQDALDECRRRRAVLLIARLDRLARNVAFIANLMEAGVEFVAVDMPQANRLTLHILAAVAEHEREMISQRTKAALTAARARGVRLGNPRPLAALQKANAAIQAARPAPEVAALAASLKAQGKGLREIARELNRLNIRAARGGCWYASSVRNLLRLAPA